MKFKLDENIGAQGARLIRSAGHDVATVRDEHLEGAPDNTLYEVCISEGRILITLDHDFGQVLRFAPENTEGSAVLELGPRPSLRSLLARLEDLLRTLDAYSIQGRLWIVEPGRIRFHLSADD